MAALALTHDAFDLGRPLLMSFLTSISNGMLYARSARHARRFLQEIDPSGTLASQMPLKGLYMSTHNVVAYDFVSTLDRLREHGRGRTLNFRNLVARAEEDLREVDWEDESDRREQFAILDSYRDAFAAGETRAPGPSGNLDRSAGARSDEGPRGLSREEQESIYREVYKRFASVLDAARFADGHYSGEPDLAAGSQ